jgi:hypothetical protein
MSSAVQDPDPARTGLFERIELPDFGAGVAARYAGRGNEPVHGRLDAMPQFASILFARKAGTTARRRIGRQRGDAHADQ